MAFKKSTLDIAKKLSFILNVKTYLYRIIIQPILLNRIIRTHKRSLEIGPGEVRILGFETVNIIKTKNTDFVADVTKKLPFGNDTFDIVYASHILEHTPWYMLDNTIKEWARVIKKGGILEVWVPDGLKIAQAFCDAEANINNNYMKDGWYRFNENKDPTVWFSGRMFSYGDGLGTRGHFNYHLAAFSERYLKKLFMDAGFENIQKMKNEECRGYDHGWINLGIKGTKCFNL